MQTKIECRLLFVTFDVGPFHNSFFISLCSVHMIPREVVSSYFIFSLCSCCVSKIEDDHYCTVKYIYIYANLCNNHKQYVNVTRNIFPKYRGEDYLQKAGTETFKFKGTVPRDKSGIL